MTAVVTDSFRQHLAELFLNEVLNSVDSNQFYVGIGKSDQYNDSDIVPTTYRTEREERLLRANLQSIVKVAASSLVIPRYNWSSGTLYDAWSDYVEGLPTNAYYVLTEDQEVYICLKQPKNEFGIPTASTVQPSYSRAGADQNYAFHTADGYVWKFCYQLSAVRSNNFLSASWMPIQNPAWETLGDSSSLNTFDLQQLAVRNRARGGQVIGAALISGGSGYTSAPTVTINGDGRYALATATIAGGAVVKIEMDNESEAFGIDYSFADITISGGGGSGASARAIVGPRLGFGRDMVRDLKGSSVMMNVKTSGSVSGTFIADGTQDFRQIALINNPLIRDGDGARFTGSSDKVLRKLRLSDPAEAVTFTSDTLIRGDNSGAAAFIDEIDSDIIYYHQNETTGFIQFENSELILESDGIGSGTIADSGIDITQSTVDPFTGNIFYVENRARVVRDIAQQEDIKIIISL